MAIYLFFSRSIEVQVLSWKSIPSICASLQAPGYKSGADVVMLLRAAVLALGRLQGLLLLRMEMTQVEQVGHDRSEE